MRQLPPPHQLIPRLYQYCLPNTIYKTFILVTIGEVVLTLGI